MDNIKKLSDELYLNYKFEIMYTYVTMEDVAMQIYADDNDLIYDGELKEHECIKLLDTLKDQLFKLYGRNKYLNRIYIHKDALEKLIRYGYDELKETLNEMNRIYLIDDWSEIDYAMYVEKLDNTMHEYQAKWWNEYVLPPKERKSDYE